MTRTCVRCRSSAGSDRHLLQAARVVIRHVPFSQISHVEERGGGNKTSRSPRQSFLSVEVCFLTLDGSGGDSPSVALQWRESYKDELVESCVVAEW